MPPPNRRAREPAVGVGRAHPHGLSRTHIDGAWHSGALRTDPRDELERLVAGERVCCGWAEWTVSVAEDEIVLMAVASDDPGPEVLRQLFRL